MKLLLKFWRNRRSLRFLDKRQRFALQTVTLTVGLLVSQLIWQDYRILTVAILAVSSYLLTAWSLTEDVKGVEWLLLFILPVLFTISVSLFYFLLPARWSTRVLVTLTFAIGTYATLLVENIYNVAIIRSIQLLRAAQSVGLLISLVVVFLSVSIVFSIRANFWQNLLILAPLTFILALQALWSVKLETVLSKQIFTYAAIVGVGVGEMAIVLSFWPVPAATASLFITASFYTLVGLMQQYFLERLFKNTVREYILPFFVTLLVTLITARWG